MGRCLLIIFFLVYLQLLIYSKNRGMGVRTKK